MKKLFFLDIDKSSTIYEYSFMSFITQEMKKGLGKQNSGKENYEKGIYLSGNPIILISRIFDNYGL